MTKMTDINSLIGKIEIALNNNLECKAGILSGQRIFIAERKGYLELLVFLETSTVDCVGHVVYLNGKWRCSLIAIKGYISGESAAEVIEDFWSNIKNRIGYDLAFLEESSLDYMESTSFRGGAEHLIKMIELYKPSMWDSKSFAIYDIYGSDPLIDGSHSTRR